LIALFAFIGIAIFTIASTIRRERAEDAAQQATSANGKD